MTPGFLVPDELRSGDGRSPSTAVPAFGTLTIVLGITRISEMQSLALDIEASADGVHWDPAPVLRFPQKFYCGTYSLLIDLTDHPWVGFIRAKWTVNRWDSRNLRAGLSFYVFAEKARQPAELAAAY